MLTSKEYQQRFYTSIDVKIKRNAKLKLDRKITSGVCVLPDVCQKKGCENIRTKIIFRSYSKLSYLCLCEAHVIKFIEKKRGALRFDGDGDKWVEKGLKEAWYGTSKAESGYRGVQHTVVIDHHHFPPQYYQGYRHAHHGESHALTRYDLNAINVNLSTSSKRYW